VITKSRLGCGGLSESNLIGPAARHSPDAPAKRSGPAGDHARVDLDDFPIRDRDLEELKGRGNRPALEPERSRSGRDGAARRGDLSRREAELQRSHRGAVRRLDSHVSPEQRAARCSRPKELRRTRRAKDDRGAIRCGRRCQ